MTKEEKKRLSAVLRATEYLFLENIALKPISGKRGYLWLATEAASGWVQKAFGELKLDRLAAIVHPESYASIRVLQKLGFLEARRDVIIGMSSIVCGLTPDTARNPIPYDWRSPLI